VNRRVVLNDQDKVSRIEILDRVRKTETVLRKEDDRWFLEVPVRYPADEAVVEGVEIAARMASRQPRLRAEKDWDEYGLARADLEVRIDVPKRKAETLFIGAQAPLGNAVFARWDFERGYLLLQAEMMHVFGQSVYSLREKRVFRTPPEEVRTVYIEMGPRSYQWKKHDGRWFWMEPIAKFGREMPPQSMNRVLTALRNLYAKKFLDGDTRSGSELGFFIIHDRIKITPEFGSPEVLHFGNEVPMENAYYGFRENESTVFLIDRGKVIALIDLLKRIEKTDGEERSGETAVASPRTSLTDAPLTS
ncbi:MAG: DUF4340 domain-containing protein, partial [Candidatus Omnitrophica bacterium]|nr:DUF4340 domain-containing protein [Candidatus Omnitrophota bacterium]